jgi:hypothetical protein
MLAFEVKPCGVLNCSDVSMHVAFTIFRESVRLSIMGGVRVGLDSVSGLINSEYDQNLVSVS